MKILAVNSSPHGKDGNTDIILQNLLKGMESAGATTETIYLNKLSIKPCIGCNACWFKTPGKCIHHDDMAVLLEKRNQADLIIYATPLYVFSMTGLMKNFLDRGVPNVLPFFEENTDGNKLTTHPKRYPRKMPQKMLLVGSCAFPEEIHFTPLVQTFEHIAQEQNVEYLGAILKTSSALLKVAPMQEKVTKYYDDLFIAGKQLILQGKMDAELTAKLHQPWVSDQELRNMVNQHFHSLLEGESK